MQTRPVTLSPNPNGDLARRFTGRTIAGLLLLVVAIVLVGSTTTLSWWNLSSSSGYSSGWYLGNVCSAGACQDYGGYPALHDTFGLASALVLSSIGLSILATILFVFSIPWPRLGVGVLVAGALGSLLLLAAPIYLFVALPGALQSSTPSRTFVAGFFGSYTAQGLFGNTQWTWGAGTGWYLAFVAFAVLLVSVLTAFSASRQLAMFGNLRVPPPAIPVSTTDVPEAFCPTCGTHYPAGTQFCSKDATPLKQMT